MKTCLPERFDSDFDLTRKTTTTIGSEPVRDMFVRVGFGCHLGTHLKQRVMVRYNILNIISIASNVSITIASSSGVLTPRPPPAVLQHSIQLCGPQSTETRLMLQGLKPIPIMILMPAICILQQQQQRFSKSSIGNF